MGKHIVHHYLKSKLQTKWQPTEAFPLIGLGSDFFIVKFQQEENMNLVFQNGLWFVNGHYLSVRRWEPNFVLENATRTHTFV